MKTIRFLTIALFAGASVLCAAADGSRTRYVSHRGESIDAPENTMASFRLAVERDSDGFECDIYLTADNEIVCIHDATTARTTDANLTVATSTLAELKALDAGSWKDPQFAGEKIPTLSEALTLARDDFEIYVEVKCGVEILPRLAEVLAAEPLATPERVVFIAFSTGVVSALRQQLPEYRTYWLASLGTDGSGAITPAAASVVATLQATGADGVDASANAALNAAYVSAVKAAGYSFHVWTVNSVARAAELGGMGVDTVTSDCGAALVAELAPAGDPVIHWTFDSGTATNTGSGGAAYDAELAGSPAFVAGIDGDALALDGLDDVAGVAYQLADQGTVALWYKPDAFYNYNTVFDNAVNKDWWEMWIYSDGRLTFRVKNDGSGQMFYDLDNLNGSNQWYHLALTWNKAVSNTALYVNGVLCGSGTITNWVSPGSSFYVGGGTAGNTKGKGAVDDVRIYDDALTAAQVQAVHAESAAKAPVVHLALDGATTNSGTGGARYGATLHGSPAWTNGWNNRGQALALDGVDDYLSVPYRLPASGSVALWYYVPGPWYNYNSLLDNAADANHYECWIDNAGTLTFRPAGNTWTQRAYYSLGSGSNRWHHIVGTWDTRSSNMVLYVNGVERSRAVNTTGVAWPAAGTNFFVGGGNSGNTPARGVASDIQIFETPLSSNRVAALYGEFGARGGLQAYVPFDGSAVDVAGGHAVVLGGAPEYEKAKVWRGLRCAGVGSSDHAAVSNVLGSSVGTIALWYYARGPWYNYQTVMDNAVYQEHWEGWIYNTGLLRIRVSNLSGGGAVSCDLNALRGSNAWYHIAFTWDRAAAETKLYVDGVCRSIGALSDAGWVAPDASLYLAGGNPGNTKGNGVWDELRVYDRALTADEIPALMALPPSTGTLLSVQ